MQDKESLYSQDWFEKAIHDVKSGEILLANDELETASFHIQQAIEKYLKGYLLAKGWKLIRTHDLIDLLNETICYEPLFEKFRSLCITATEFYVEDRYPFLIASEFTKEELEKIFQETKELVDFIKTKK